MKISVITPSYNQGGYIEETIRSVIGQKGPFELEYWIIDGGSTDRTIDICRKYEGCGVRLVSEPDRGQTDALNKGFARASGDVLGWLNSDDLYEEGALAAVARSYERERFQWCFGNCRNIDETGGEIRRLITRYKNFESRRYSRRRLLTKDFIPQPAVFIARSAFEETGLLNLEYDYAMDYDYWMRLASRYAPAYLDRYLARFRWHRRSKSSNHYRRAALEAYGIARKHARQGEEVYLYRHMVHVLTLSLVYCFLP
ncbi:MAG TPA: glycosyltransferase family 2 protein [Syntrophales bacterium]|nr:glycosyltransferase family 2 protein [Syntrophales bacterium]HQQ27580.1 glycosyltransferase family 2 protein [Syntrophales bacterium]